MSALKSRSFAIVVVRAVSGSGHSGAAGSPRVNARPLSGFGEKNQHVDLWRAMLCERQTADVCRHWRYVDGRLYFGPLSNLGSVSFTGCQTGAEATQNWAMGL
jgi:hypothetical protein